MLISVEHELPAIRLGDTSGVLPEVFTGLWDDLLRSGWYREAEFAVARRVRNPHPDAQKPIQVITTDTGPTIELVPCPSESIREIERQLAVLRSVVIPRLHSLGIGLLGSGVHPFLGTTEAEYACYRTPRKAYDYAVRERGWKHRSILNIAAMQEVIDIPVANAPRYVALMHRLAGIFLFLNRNDPDFRTFNRSGVLSLRPSAWRNQVPNTGKFGSDQYMVGVPTAEVGTWREYLRLLWQKHRMFMLGTKCEGLIYIPEHPTFAAFILSPPTRGWRARNIAGRDVQVMPTMEHVSQTDWSYMGFARLRIFWKEETQLPDLIAAYQSGEDHIAAFMTEHVKKVLLENRSSAAPPPGEEMCSLAFLAGLVESFGAVEEYVRRKPYAFWRDLVRAAESVPLSGNVQGIPVVEILEDLLALSSAGLARRARGEGKYLDPLHQRIRDQQSPAERMHKLCAANGIEAVVKELLY